MSKEIEEMDVNELGKLFYDKTKLLSNLQNAFRQTEEDLRIIDQMIQSKTKEESEVNKGVANGNKSKTK